MKILPHFPFSNGFLNSPLVQKRFLSSGLEVVLRSEGSLLFSWVADKHFYSVLEASAY